MDAMFNKELAQALCDLEVPRRVKFSPDGSKALYSTALPAGQRTGKNALSTLWLASTTEPGSSRQLTSGSANDTLPTWHPDGNQVLFVSDRFKPGKSSAIWALRLDGGDAAAITPVENERGIGYFTISPDGKTIAYTSADEKSEDRKKKDENGEPDPEVWGDEWNFARLRTVDLETKETRVIVGGDKHVIITDWSPDGRSLVFTSRENTDSDEARLTGTTISTVDVGSATAKDLYTLMNRAGSVTTAHDGKIYYICGTPDDSTCAGQAVYSVDPAKTLSGPTKIAHGIDDDAVVLAARGGKILVERQVRLSSSISEVGGNNIFERETNVGTWDVYFDPNSGRPIVAATLSDIENPYEVYIIKEGHEDIQLSNHGKALKDSKFGVATVLKSQSSDGLEELDGLYLTPTANADNDGKPKRPMPTFVMIHGGLMDRSCNAFDAYFLHWSPYILSQGYGVLLPQYRGSSGRGTRFAGYSHGSMGKYDYDDVISITDNAIKKGFADAKNLIVGGWSQGGYLSYLCSARNGLHGLGWRFNATIAGAGICDWDSNAITSDAGQVFESELMGRPPWTLNKDDTANRQGSALWEVAHAVAESRRLGEMVIPPMLMLHGKDDMRCPFSQAEGYRRALRAHGLPYELVAYPGEGHIPQSQRFWMDMLKRIGGWCHDYIGPGKKD
jgi:dipeptidyl aminopeptidase/acylaminoacyl peptidase